MCIAQSRDKAQKRGISVPYQGSAQTHYMVEGALSAPLFPQTPRIEH